MTVRGWRALGCLLVCGSAALMLGLIVVLAGK